MKGRWEGLDKIGQRLVPQCESYNVLLRNVVRSEGQGCRKAVFPVTG